MQVIIGRIPTVLRREGLAVGTRNRVFCGVRYAKTCGSNCTRMIIYVDNTLSYFMQLPFFLRSIFVINILEFSILYALILFLLKDYLIYNLIVFIIFFPLLIILYLKMITNIIYKIDIKFIPLDDFFYEIKIFIIGKKKDLIFTRRYDYELLLQFRARKERIPISRIYKLGYVLGFIYGLNFSFSFILFFPELILLIIALAASSTDFILFLLFIVFLLTCFAYKYRILEKDIIQDIFFIKRFSEVLSDDKDINLNIYNKLDFIIKRISKKGIEIGVWDNMKRIIKF